MRKKSAREEPMAASCFFRACATPREARTCPPRILACEEDSGLASLGVGVWILAGREVPVERVFVFPSTPAALKTSPPHRLAPAWGGHCRAHTHPPPSPLTHNCNQRALTAHYKKNKGSRALPPRFLIGSLPKTKKEPRTPIHSLPLSLTTLPSISCHFRANWAAMRASGLAPLSRGSSSHWA